MQLSPEQQKAVEAQKAQCPFCKIIKGEIPSKNVYEDELIIAILDINPANKGHTLVMPKEHYPILPLIPPNVFEHLAVRTKEISRAIKEGALVFGDNIFIANGAAAGQQSQHFMLHIIPREENDGIDIFKFEKIDVEKDKEAEAYKILSHNLPIMLKEIYKRFPLPGKQALEGTTEAIRKGKRAYTKDELLKIIEMNPQLKQAIIQNPEQFKQLVPNHPQLKQLFADVNIDKVIEAVTGKKENIVDAEITKETSQEEMGIEEEKKKTDEEKAEGIEEEKETKKIQQADEETETRYEELFEILDANPKLKSLLVEHTEILRMKIEAIKELKEIFNEIDLENLREAVIKRDKEKERREKDIEQNKQEDEEPETPEAPQEETDETQEEGKEGKNKDEDEEEEKKGESSQKEPDLDTISDMFRREFG